MPRQLTIRELNPQKAPEAIPGLSVNLRMGQSSGYMLATYHTMKVARPIQITSGDVLIVDEGRPESAASNLALPAPPKRDGYERGADGSVLRIISTCPFKHIVRTPPNVINGAASLLKFAGLGAIEMYAHAGKWIVLSSSGVAIE